jgi:hypothetical protein
VKQHPPPPAQHTRLNEFDKEEWFDVCRQLKPGLSRLQYEKEWAKFQAFKAAHEKKMSLH